MSTELGKIMGRKERVQPSSLINQSSPKYREVEMNLLRFAGGIKNGAMLQISLDDDYIQLNRVQVETLKRVLATF